MSSAGESGITSLPASLTVSRALLFALSAASLAFSAIFGPAAPAIFSATNGTAANAAPAIAMPAGLLRGPSPLLAFLVAFFASSVSFSIVVDIFVSPLRSVSVHVRSRLSPCFGAVGRRRRS